MKRTLNATWCLVGGPTTTTMAAPPTMARDHGAYVRLVGHPARGTAEFQFGWDASTSVTNLAAIEVPFTVNRR